MLFPLNVTGGTDPRWNSVFYVCQEVSTLQKMMFQKDRGTLDATEGVVKQQNGRKCMGLIFGFEIHESTRGFMHGLTHGGWFKLHEKVGDQRKQEIKQLHILGLNLQYARLEELLFFFLSSVFCSIFI